MEVSTGMMVAKASNNKGIVYFPLPDFFNRLYYASDRV